MMPLPGSDSWNVEQLLEAVEQLSPADRREFQRRLTSGQAANGSTEPEEAKLIQACLQGRSVRAVKAALDREGRKNEA